MCSAMHRGSRSSSSTAAAQQQHSSSSSSSGGGGGGAAAAAASSPSESRAGCCVVSPLLSVCVLLLCVYIWLSLVALESYTTTSKPSTITGVHSNQDEIWLVKIGEYIGFYVYRRSSLLWSPVNNTSTTCDTPSIKVTIREVVIWSHFTKILKNVTTTDGWSKLSLGGPARGHVPSRLRAIAGRKPRDETRPSGGEIAEKRL